MKISRELKIGVIAVVTIAAFIWGLNFLKGVNILKSSDDYYIVYDKINGLIESGIVYLNGYKVGNVSAIDFDSKNPGKIVVTMALAEKIQIPVNSVALITSSSLISGIKDLELLFSDSTVYYKPGDTIPGAVDKGFSAMIDPFKVQVEETIANIDTILIVMRNIFNENTQENLKNTFAHLDTIAAGLSSSLEPGGGISRGIENIADITGELKKKSGELASILVSFASISDSLANSEIKSTINNTNKTIEATNEILQKIKNGEGTAGMLIHNDTLYNNLKSASQNLDILIKDLKEHPKKYVHFSLFGGKEKQEKSR